MHPKTSGIHPIAAFISLSEGERERTLIQPALRLRQGAGVGVIVDRVHSYPHFPGIASWHEGDKVRNVHKVNSRKLKARSWRAYW
jgi:hypothetical protein